MVPHHAFLIGAGWPRELGTGYLSIATGTLSHVVAKPLISIYKSVSMGIPAAIFSFFAFDFKIGCTCTFEQRIWVPTLPYVIAVSFFVSATYQKFRIIGDQVVTRHKFSMQAVTGHLSLRTVHGYAICSYEWLQN